MSLRRAQAWVWWLLPFWVARAVMPVGFMAQAVHGSLQIVFCAAGYVQSNETGDHSVHSLHTDSDHSSQHAFSCPFAHAAAAPLLDFGGTEAIVYVPKTAVVPSTDAPYSGIGPPRVVAARGPPARA